MAKPRNFAMLSLGQLGLIYSRKALFMTGMDHASIISIKTYTRGGLNVVSGPHTPV